MSNIFLSQPVNLDNEFTEVLLKSNTLRIEKIISKGHTSPEKAWYDQEEHEWVLVLEGGGKILFEDGSEVLLLKGDYLNIPAHSRHRVTWTDPDKLTVWLAVFYT